MELTTSNTRENHPHVHGDQSSSSSRLKNSAYYQRNFRLFSVIASANHALNYVVNSFSFALLSPFLGAVTLGLNWTLNSVSGLFVSTPVVKRLGFKRAIIIAFWGYTIQILSFFLAIYFPEFAWPFGMIGAIIAGLNTILTSSYYYYCVLFLLLCVYTHTSYFSLICAVFSSRFNFTHC